MYNLDSLPVSQLDRYAGTDKEKVFALIDAYVAASNVAYTANVQSPTFVQKQQTAIALGRVVREVVERLTGD